MRWAGSRASPPSQFLGLARDSGLGRSLRALWPARGAELWQRAQSLRPIRPGLSAERAHRHGERAGYQLRLRATGDLQTITDNLAAGRSQSLQYDALYRLTQASGAYGTYVYGYDAVGNRTSLALTGTGSNFASTYNYASTSNQLQSVVTGATTRTFAYSATGNIASDNFGTGTVYNFTYNQDNRLAQSAGAWTTPYKYDYRGRRIFKVNPNFDYFHYDRADHMIAETLFSGLSLHEYVWLDDLPLAFIASGGINYIHTDHLGAPQKMTNPGQTIVWDAVSDPFMAGQLPTNPQMYLRFPGQYFDAETALHQNGMRDYGGAISGTIIEPGGGTIVGGATGAYEGAATGAAIGAAAGSIIEDTIMQMAKGGREKGENEFTRAAKSEAQSSGKDPCDILDQWLANAKATGDTASVQKLQTAQKYMGCRNKQKRGIVPVVVPDSSCSDQ